ncbi:MAG: heparinase II/III family protein [Azospirillaceae bacterium]
MAARRFAQKLKSFAFGSRLYGLTLRVGGHAPRDLALVPPDPWPGSAEAGQRLIDGVFHFASETREVEAPPWYDPEASEAFLVQLHGFDWLRDLRAVGGDTARRIARDFACDWIREHDRWDPLAWRPDVLGARVANWLALHDFFCASADDAQQRLIYGSLARQVTHLARSVPGQLAGHRLIVALKGLLFGTLSLELKEKILLASLDALVAALPEQILPDGGHVERNPSLLLAVLRHLVDVRAALRAFRIAVPDEIQQAIDRMAPALRFFRHGDGGLALFNGGFEEEPVLIDTVLAQADAKGRPVKSAVQSGYERVLQNRTLLLMDVGGPPPAGVDLSAHAGLLAFELSVGRERLIVNCGAWPGGGGEAGYSWHQALRATAAHTTVTVGDTNALALVPEGGVKRRGQTLRNLIEHGRNEGEGTVLLEARHEGYHHEFNIAHRRRIFVGGQGQDIRGEDALEPGRGRHRGGFRWHVRFHLHPSVQVAMTQSGDTAILRTPSGVGWRFRVSGGDLSLEDSIYFGGGEPRASHQLVVAGSTLPEGTLVKWALRREKRD